MIGCYHIIERLIEVEIIGTKNVNRYKFKSSINPFNA